MRPPLAVRVLLGWLVLVALVPAAVGLGESLGVLRGGLLLPAVATAVLLAALGLALFEPPRQRSVRGWLQRLRARLVPVVSQSSSASKEH
jgi:peptidoglycan/LPS O-acetylase OafA/YrhL